MENIATKRYDYIDALRGFAILGVVLVHTLQLAIPTSDTLVKIVSEGARGVQLFYIASAMTLFLSMESKREYEKKSVQNYFIRRFFRIAPAFYLAIIVYTAYDGFSPRFWAPNGIEWWFILLTALFLHGWHPETITSVVPGGWSIAVEMTFYLLVPFLFSKLKDIKKTLAAIFLSLIISKILSLAVVNFFSPYYPAKQQYLVSEYSSLWFFSQLPVFLLGILLYHLINRYPREDKRTAFLLLLSSFFLFFAFLTVRTFGDLLPHHFLYGIAFVIFALSLYYWPQIFLVNRFTVLVGRISFSIYLVHFMVLNLIEKLLPDGLVLTGNLGFALAYLLVLCPSICIAYVTFKFIEAPGINLGRYVIRTYAKLNRANEERVTQ